MTGRTGRRSSRDRKQKSALAHRIECLRLRQAVEPGWLRYARSAIDLEKRRGDGDVHTVYLLRHAKSDWSDQTLPDHARPLAPRGRRDAKRIAKHLRRRGIAPMLVLCSSAERTRETLELVRPALGGAPVQIEDGLYAAANEELLERLRVLPEQSASVLVIGHNPGLQELALVLATPGRTRRRLEAKFPTAALATLAVSHATWAQLAAGDAELAAFVVPKQLR